MAECPNPEIPKPFGVVKVLPVFENLRGKMSITVDVGLLSGKTATVKADLDEEVGALERRAQIALGVGRGRLVGSSGSALDAFANDQAFQAAER